MVQLSNDIQELVNKSKVLVEKEPQNQSLIDQYDGLHELLKKAQDKEWNELQTEYTDAKKALEAANAELQKRLAGLSTTAATIEKTAAAIDKVITALAAIGVLI
ncbi:MAG: hypothetical protein WC405_05765 [Syntrophales bacterium]